ncbi:MAG: TorF family putative porin, partial [Terriglobia bacterium]
MAVSRSVAALCGSASVALLALTGTASAEDKFAWSASLTGTSDYVFRGVSQTNNDPTIQGSLGVTYGMFYAGWWASGLDWQPLDSKAQVEMDWYGGIKPTWGPASFDFGVIYYTYPGSMDVAPFGSTSIVELKAGVSGEIMKNLTAGVTYYYAPDVNDFDYGVVEASLS